MLDDPLRIFCGAERFRLLVDQQPKLRDRCRRKSVAGFEGTRCQVGERRFAQARYLITGRLSSVRQLAESGLASGPTM
jgi:hypothetical protein